MQMDNGEDNVDTQLLCKTQGRVCHHCPNHHHHHHPNGTCSRDERPKARFAISEEDEAPRARQVGDIRSCKSMTTMMMITMTVHGIAMMAMEIMMLMRVRPGEKVSRPKVYFFGTLFFQGLPKVDILSFLYHSHKPFFLPFESDAFHDHT